MDDFRDYADQFATPDDALSQAKPTFGSGVSALGSRAWEASPLSSIARIIELESAGTGSRFIERTMLGGMGEDQTWGETPMIAADDAKAQASEAGVTVDFGTGETTVSAVNLLIERAVNRKQRDEVIAARDPSLLTQLGVGFGVSALDPLNVASAFIPVVPTAMYTARLAQASGPLARAGIRAAAGAAEGVVGAAIVEPLIAAAATQEGQDYSMADSLHNLAFGGIFGMGIHVGAGSAGELLFKRRFAGDVPSAAAKPADLVDLLPEASRETLLRSTIADLVEGNPVKAGAVLDEVVKANPALDARMSLENTLRKDGPEINDTEGRQLYWENRLKGAKVEKPVDLRSWITSIGGIIDRNGLLSEELGASKVELPRGAIITEKGFARLKEVRGMELDATVDAAIAAGYASTRDDFIAKLKTGGRLVLTEADRKAAAGGASELAHMTAMKTGAGVSPTAKHSFAARQLVAYEQQLVTAERSRRAESASAIAGQPARPGEVLTPVKPGEAPDITRMTADTENTLQALQGEPYVKPEPEARGDAAPAGPRDETAERIAAISEKLDAAGKAELAADVMRLTDESSKALRAFDVATLCAMGA